jgi:hypothetical protein
MAQFNFISGLEQESERPTVKFQIFEAKIGDTSITATVKIPLEKASLFEDEAYKVKPTTLQSLNRLAKKFGGNAE